MAKFKPYKIESSQLENLSVSEGQFIVTTDTQKVYLDEDSTTRIELSPSPTKTSELVNDSNFMSGMFIAAYGKTTYADVLDAYKKGHIVYCRASSSSNPASGNQLRMAFLAYINNETTPTEFEFQYYRSVATHSDSQQGDQVYIYKLKSASGWENSVREAYTKVIAGTDLSSSYNSGKITLNHGASGVTAGTYNSVTVNTQGHVTAGSNPTTISGYGITDAKIDSGVITLGSNTITPLTSSDIGDAAAKNVDSSISAASTSTNLPTSQAVASFVEGKGYVTTDTKNTAGSTSSSSKLYLIGATSQAANPQTYSNSNLYFNNGLYSLGSAGQGSTITSINQTGTTLLLKYEDMYASNSITMDSTGMVISGLKTPTNNKDAANKKYVDDSIAALPEPMVFKGSLGTGGTITALPVDGSATVGDTYKVITDGTYASQAAKAGDTFVCDSKTSSTNT